MYRRCTDAVRTLYGRKASKASPAKRSEPVWAAMHITHA